MPIKCILGLHFRIYVRSLYLFLYNMIYQVSPIGNMYKQYNHESCTTISFVYKCKSEQVHLHCTLYNAHTPVLCVFPIHIYIITYTRDRALGMPPLSYFLTFIPCLMHNPVQLLTTMYWLVLICTNPIHGQFTLLVYISCTRDKKANFVKFLLH